VAIARPRLARRAVMKLAMAAIAAVAVGGHTPYGQWTVYRQRNLFIVASRTDGAALALARALVAGLAEELPESRARVTRATDPVRIASLLATGQLDVAVVSREEAAKMLAGSGDFSVVGPVPLRSLADLGTNLVVTVDGLKPRHAYLLALAIDHLRPALPVAAAALDAPAALPMHPGAAAYYDGLPTPETAE
jgi:TRAP-type uncharacterized transport system substrate-binding protein